MAILANAISFKNAQRRPTFFLNATVRAELKIIENLQYQYLASEYTERNTETNPHLSK